MKSNRHGWKCSGQDEWWVVFFRQQSTGAESPAKTRTLHVSLTLWAIYRYINVCGGWDTIILSIFPHYTDTVAICSWTREYYVLRIIKLNSASILFVPVLHVFVSQKNRMTFVISVLPYARLQTTYVVVNRNNKTS